ncbi:MAG: hypothetical protein M3460_20445 [Actinomycetota bacterium]|nr:hypothetical protein [Actinomycetota bacterium]
MGVAVYERDRSRTDRLEGYRIHINPAGSRALKACLPTPVFESFVATAGEPGGIGFLTEQLKELVVINGETTADPAESSHTVGRITLRHLLLSGLDDVVRFGKTTKGSSVGIALQVSERDHESAAVERHAGQSGSISSMPMATTPRASRSGG